MIYWVEHFTIHGWEAFWVYGIGLICECYCAGRLGVWYAKRFIWRKNPTPPSPYEQGKAAGKMMVAWQKAMADFTAGMAAAQDHEAEAVQRLKGQKGE